MGPFDPDLLVPMLAMVLAIPGGIALAAMIFRYVLKKNEMKLREKELEMRGSDPELGREVEALRDDLNDTRAQLADMQERLDFAERLLTAGRASQEDRSG